MDSGSYVLRAIIEIKKRKYWPKYIDGDSIDAHFEGKEVGSIDSLPGKIHNIPFDIFAMHEPDYVMKLMSTYVLMSFSWIILQKGRIFKIAKRSQKTSIMQKLDQTTSSIVTFLMIIMLNNTLLYVLNMFGQYYIGSTVRSPCYYRSKCQPCRSTLHLPPGSKTTTLISKDAC